MPQIINTNINSLTAQRNLNNAQSDNSQALNRLSSGLRINSSKDDAAGLAISTRFESQISGLNVATRNAGDGVSLAQTAEGGLDSITTNLSRLRELAVQSANATNTDVDREALNAEATQIIDEIGRISDQTNFNGVKLLNGGFEDQTFQVGANVGETIDVSIAEVTTSTLGVADTAGLSGNVSGTLIAANAAAGADLALVAGDLAINGIAVGASDSTSDTSSNALKGSSAISKAAAINEVSDQTGVTATVNENTVEGTNMTTTTAGANDYAVTLNGVAFAINVADSATADGARVELNKVADQLNTKTDATGVTATVVGTTDGYRIDLAAADGRNIDIAVGTAGDAAAVGLATGGVGAEAATYLGNVTLVSEDGSDINLSTTTGDIDNAGFEEGSFSGVTAGVVGDASDDTARAALVSGDLTINGVNVGVTSAADDTASTASESASSISLAAAINGISDQTGVTAEANVNTTYSGDVTAGAVANDVTINGVSISVAEGANVGEQLANVIDGVNAVSGQTGVRAEVLDGNQLKLVADDGRNIVVAGTTTNTGLTADTFIGGVTLTSAGEFTVGTQTGGNEKAGLRVGSYGGSESGTLLKDVDISTVEGANAAIKAVDNALTQVNTERANLGAIQNRFDNTISSNQINSENLSAANSRIKDADFAAETAALSRSSVLQQAGISILAQANAQPQQVLSLLG